MYTALAATSRLQGQRPALDALLQQRASQLLIGAAAIAIIATCGLARCDIAAPARTPVQLLLSLLFGLLLLLLLLLLLRLLLPLLRCPPLPERCLLSLLQRELKLVCQVSSGALWHAARLLRRRTATPATSCCCTSRCIPASCTGRICLVLLPLLFIVAQHGRQGGPVGGCGCGLLLRGRQQVQQSCLCRLLGESNVQGLPAVECVEEQGR